MAQQTTTTLARHYARILKQWPQDLLRPSSAFTSLLAKRQQQAASASASAAAPAAAATTSSASAAGTATAGAAAGADANETRRINALYALLDDRFAKKWPIRADMLRPEANPRHYAILMKDIDEAPTRTKAVSWWNNVAGKIRLR